MMHVQKNISFFVVANEGQSVFTDV